MQIEKEKYNKPSNVGRNSGGLFDAEERISKLAEMEAETLRDGFWDDRESAQRQLQRITAIKDEVKNFTALQSEIDDIGALWELATEAGDESLDEEIGEALGAWNARVDKLELAALLSGPYDSHNAILSLHAGAGGVEAQDWVEMLYRMYSRYCERAGYKLELMDLLPGDEAGNKSVTFGDADHNAYGYLKS